MASENKEHKLSEVEDLFRKKREEIDQETCKKCIEHVKRLEEEFYKSGRIIDVAVEKLGDSLDTSIITSTCIKAKSAWCLPGNL